MQVSAGKCRFVQVNAGSNFSGLALSQRPLRLCGANDIGQAPVFSVLLVFEEIISAFSAVSAVKTF